MPLAVTIAYRGPQIQPHHRIPRHHRQPLYIHTHLYHPEQYNAISRGLEIGLTALTSLAALFM